MGKIRLSLGRREWVLGNGALGEVKVFPIALQHREEKSRLPSPAFDRIKMVAGPSTGTASWNVEKQLRHQGASCHPSAPRMRILKCCSPNKVPRTAEVGMVLFGLHWLEMKTQTKCQELCDLPAKPSALQRHPHSPSSLSPPGQLDTNDDIPLSLRPRYQISPSPSDAAQISRRHGAYLIGCLLHLIV
jgi:hypothetical protein